MTFLYTTLLLFFFFLCRMYKNEDYSYHLLNINLKLYSISICIAVCKSAEKSWTFVLNWLSVWLYSIGHTSFGYLVSGTSIILITFVVWPGSKAWRRDGRIIDKK